MPIYSPELAELHIADPPERWQALGFAVQDAAIGLGGVTIRLGAHGHGITAWALRGIAATGDIDGLPTTAAMATASPPPAMHPNGATAIDHVVIASPDFDRTAAALDHAGLPLRRTRNAGTFRQGFRRLGPAILELVEDNRGRRGPARFWGLVVTVEDLDALAQRLRQHLGPVKPAVQQGRRIATLRETAGLTPKVAFMTPEP